MSASATLAASGSATARQASSPGAVPGQAAASGQAAAPVQLQPTYSSDGLNEALLDEATVLSLRQLFDAASPFPHLVIDGLFDPAMLERVAADYDKLNREDWIKYETANEVKFGTRPNVRLGPGSQAYFDTIHRAKFTGFLSGITGIQALVPDPMLRGGGLHEIPVGGKFKVHVDFTRHVDTKLDNRLVFITYLNKGWQPEWGGALELWTREACTREVVPVFGRSIVFAHTAHSLHGHPAPVATPDGRTRRSVAAYFYTNGRPDPTPAERITTQFLNPEIPVVPLRERASKAVRYVLPPMVMDGLRLAKPLLRRGR
ncbi:2OG-Fe(II) oxygenase [Lichenicoccus roseus]|uniref:2OG-Fe(II) oxygenase n=1 Tax=Lichenicoccus roseus TaxID=2683649 RepID=A0A5R9JBK4_9PROT|nr:2OG-Fe(II) oxygenase [Lichenicoccus roseus]TLU73917.1 2OG-Fe(II) oxygenase [Lichenicoccus roseus]